MKLIFTILALSSLSPALSFAENGTTCFSLSAGSKGGDQLCVQAVNVTAVGDPNDPTNPYAAVSQGSFTITRTDKNGKTIDTKSASYSLGEGSTGWVDQYYGGSKDEVTGYDCINSPALSRNVIRVHSKDARHAPGTYAGEIDYGCDSGQVYSIYWAQ